jgi:nucleotide-binding universal stress UspA family protein
MKILVPVDGSIYSKEALKIALECAKTKGADVNVISVASDVSGVDLEISAGERERIGQRMEQQAESILQEACEEISKAGVKADCRVISAPSSVASAILGLSKEIHADLIIMGSLGVSPSSRLKMGGVASQVVKYSDCSVYVVRFPHPWKISASF